MSSSRNDHLEFEISLNVRCSEHGDHGPYSVSHRVLYTNSKRVPRLIDPEKREADLDSAGRGYSCSTLRSIIATWKQQEHQDHPPPHSRDAFKHLVALSRALWDFCCSPRWFEGFARNVHDYHWHRHLQQGSQSAQWGFIALVFGWQHVFSLAALDLTGLGRRPADHDTYECTVLRNIIRREDYRARLKSTYTFLRITCARLDSKRDQELVSRRIRDCFQAHNFTILLDEDLPENRDAINSTSVTGLLRLFDSFLREDPSTPEPTTPQSSGLGTPNNRFPHEPFMWRFATKAIHKLGRNKSVWDESLIQSLWVPARNVLLQHTEDHRRSEVARFLELNERAMHRFETLRSDYLILTVENGAAMELPNGRAPVGELATSYNNSIS